jgi:hypothetical protein
MHRLCLVVGSSVSVGSRVTGDSIVARRGRMVTGANRLVAVIANIRRSDGGASVGGIVARAVVVGTGRSSKTTSGSGYSSNLRVTVLGDPVSLPALPELHTGALGVAVGRAGTEALLLLVVAHEEDLEESAQQKEEGGDDGDGKAGSIESASGAQRGSVGDLVALAIRTKGFLGIRRAVANRSLYIARAAGSSITGHDGNCNHGTAAEEVEEYAKNSEDGLSNGQRTMSNSGILISYLSTEAACQQDSQDGVENDGARETSDGLLPCCNESISVSLYREEVTVDSEYDGSAAELEGIEGCGAKLQCSTTEAHGCGRCQVRRRKEQRRLWVVGYAGCADERLKPRGLEDLCVR